MASSNADYGFGIEEEYFLADLNSFDAPAETPEALFEELQEKTGEKTARESLQAQLEVATAPSTSVAEVREDLRRLRKLSAEAAPSGGRVYSSCKRQPGSFLFGGRRGKERSLTARQYARLVSTWVAMVGLDASLFGTHSLRRTKATLIYRKTGNLRAVQLLLGHSKVESTVRYLGIEVDDALAIAEQVDI